MKKIKQNLGTIKLTEFAMRHFESKFGGTKILNLEPKEFEFRLNEYKNLYYENPLKRFSGKELIVDIFDGYASFCKLLVIKNFTNAKTGTLPITIENYQYIRSGYSSRRDNELPVLTRWLELPLGAPIANYLIIVLYNKRQIDKEAESMYDKNKSSENIEHIEVVKPIPFDADFGVVAILAQMSHLEEKMNPITMMRNYMAIEFGGSGVMPTKPIKPNHFDYDNNEEFKMSMSIYENRTRSYEDKIKKFESDYKSSVKFWEKNITVK